jgi:Asp-tRNA(Asn)/Glu-tRNA(Gln) amidotransferase C subunit
MSACLSLFFSFTHKPCLCIALASSTAASSALAGELPPCIIRIPPSDASHTPARKVKKRNLLKAVWSSTKPTWLPQLKHFPVDSPGSCSYLCSAPCSGVRPFLPAEHSAPSWSLQDYASQRSNSPHPPVAPITPAELAHLAQLSHLALPESASASASLLREVESVVEWVGCISRLEEMNAHEPMYTPLEVPEYYSAMKRPQAAPTSTPAPASARPSLACPSDPSALRLRADVVTDGSLEKQLLTNASYKHRGFFVVPKTDSEES